MKKLNPIVKRMRERDRRVLQFVRVETREHGAYRPIGMGNVSWYNSLGRLEADGHIKWSHKKGGYVAK